MLIGFADVSELARRKFRLVLSGLNELDPALGCVISILPAYITGQIFPMDYLEKQYYTCTL
jgi:hypothetical protein